jgi:hypothetical protein
MALQHDRGRRAERNAARVLGGRRVGNSGKATEDVSSDWLACEVKSRQTLPEWLKGAMRQAEGAAARHVKPRLPLVVLHEVGGRAVDDLVLLRAGDWAAWFGDWRGRGDDEQV